MPTDPQPATQPDAAAETNEQAQASYVPSAQELAVINEEYADVQVMIDRRNESRTEFGDRTLKTFIDDNDKQLAPYVVDRASYNPPKEDWQSNVPLPIIRTKQEQVLAGYSLSVPDMNCRAFGSDGNLDLTDRAYIAKNLVQGSYLQEENIMVENFWEAWEGAGRGTVIKYEGYLKTRAKQKFITKYDAVAGKVEFVEREVDIDDKCISYLLPLLEFYPWDFAVDDVQDQYKTAWIRYVDKATFDLEFGHYANHKFVLNRSEALATDQEGFYSKGSPWVARVKDEQYEICKIYCKSKDTYRILVNGVLMQDAPLLWKKNGVKIYPFAKGIHKPFVSKHFFYGNPFPNVLAAMVDSANTTLNTISDKQWRSMVPPTLVGAVNRDSFDLEDEYIAGTTKISCADVNQVKPMPIEGITNADVIFFNLLNKLLDDMAPSLPAMLGNKQATAREIVIANEKIDELKITHREMMADLWRQKYGIRLANIQLNYPQPRKIFADDGTVTEYFRTYIIEDCELDGATGERGTLAIVFKPMADQAAKDAEAQESAIQEAAFKQKGINFKRLVCTPEYLDNVRYHIAVITGAVTRASQGQAQAVAMEKIGTAAKFFPEIFATSMEDYFAEWSAAYDDKPDKYLKRYADFKAAKQQMMDAMAAAQNGGGPGGAPGGPGGAPAGKPAPEAGATPINPAAAPLPAVPAMK